MGEWLSSRGRIGRARYVARLAILAGAVYGMCFVAGLLSGLRGGAEAMSRGMLLAILGLCAAGPALFEVVKRLHDLGRSGVQAWLLLVPVYNLVLGARLLFQRGEPGLNQFGPDPLPPPDGARPILVAGAPR